MKLSMTDVQILFSSPKERYASTALWQVDYVAASPFLIAEEVDNDCKDAQAWRKYEKQHRDNNKDHMIGIVCMYCNLLADIWVCT